MSLTFYGHACVLVEVVRPDGRTTRLLLDPGNLAGSLDELPRLDAILITHAHPDHVDSARVARLRADSAIPIYGDQGVADLLAIGGIVDSVHITQPGELLVGDLTVDVSTWQHEVIYPGLPLPENLGYLIGGRVFAPGDAFAVPGFPVEVLLVPTGAPWMKLGETIDYLCEARPRIAIPVHDGGLADVHRELHRAMMEKFAPEGTKVVPLNIGAKYEI